MFAFFVKYLIVTFSDFEHLSTINHLRNVEEEHLTRNMTRRPDQSSEGSDHKAKKTKNTHLIHKSVEVRVCVCVSHDKSRCTSITFI